MIQKSIGLFFIVIIFASCKQQNEDPQIKTLITGLQHSDSMIRNSIFIMKMDFQQRLQDPMYYNVYSWYPYSKRIKGLSDSIYSFVDSLNNKLQEKEPNMNDLKTSLFGKLLQYKNDLINVLYLSDSLASPQLQHDLTMARKRFHKELPLPDATSRTDTADMAEIQTTWFDSTFGNASPLMCQAILNKIKVDILISQHAVLRYCFNKTTYHGDSFDVFRAIATIDSRVIRQGEPLIVTAGVGAFSISMKPSIKIDGKNMALTTEGVAEYEFTPKTKPGKHSIPVEFEYFKPDGTKERIKKTIRYTIVP